MQLDPKGLEAAMTAYGLDVVVDGLEAAIRAYLEAAPSPSPAPGVVEALNSFAIYTVYTVEDEDDWVYLSAGGVQIARVEAFTKRGIALLKLNASVQAALASLSQPAKGEREGGAFAEMLTALRQVEAEMRAGLGSSYGETREQVRRAIASAERCGNE